MYLLNALATAELLAQGSRLDGASRGFDALLLLGAPLLALATLAVLYWRTRAEMRRRELEPPLYLLTLISAAASPGGNIHSPPADHEDVELDRGRLREMAGLKRRATRLLVVLGIDVVALWLGTMWVLRSGRDLDPGPHSSQLIAVLPPVPDPAATQPAMTTDVSAASLDARLEAAPASSEPAPATRDQRDSAATRDTPATRGTAVPAAAPPSPRRDPAAAPRTDTGATPPVNPPQLDPVSTPSQPAPVAVRADPAPPPPASTAVVDPAVERASAERALGLAVRQLAGDLASQRAPAGIARLAEWLRTTRPTVNAAELAELAIEGTRGEAIVPVTFRWRDDFGVGKQRAVRFRIAVERTGDDWLFTGAELLDRFP